MTENEKRIEQLILKYARYEALTDEEMAILQEWRDRSAEHDALPDKFRDEKWVEESLTRLSRIPSEQIWQRISERVEKEKRLITPWYIKVAGAAAGIALIVVAVRAFVPTGPKGTESGKELVASIAAPEQVFSNPKGQQGGKLIVLPDGTRVLLNSASTITYPKAFAADKRIVRLDGEGYFDVAKNPGRPFVVQTAYGSTQDKSTEFNVRAYAEERNTKVTVVEGAVIVKDNNGKSEKELDPLQQVQLTSEGIGGVETLKSTDQVVAWQTGLIHFERIPLRVAMKELERRYDKKVIFSDGVKGIALDQFDVPPGTTWEQTLAQLKDMEKEAASFREMGDTVYVGN